MDNYELGQYKQIQEWKNEKPSVVSKAVGVVLSPLTWVVNKVIPQKAISGALTACDKIAELVTDTADIKRDAKVGKIQELAHKNLELSDRLANEVHNWALGIASVEGAVTGATGLLGMAIDIPALITMSLRVIHKIGLCYGFECKTEQDKNIILSIMSVAGANTMEEKMISLTILQRMNVMIAKTTWKAISEKAMSNHYGLEAAIIAIKTLAKQLGVNITKRKALQAIPLVGGGVGAVINVDFVNDVAWAARRVFQEQWLLINGKIEHVTD